MSASFCISAVYGAKGMKKKFTFTGVLGPMVMVPKKTSKIRKVTEPVSPALFDLSVIFTAQKWGKQAV